MGTKLNPLQNKVDVLSLGRIKLYDEKNKEVIASSLWKDASVVLIFVRHFSCIACRAHIDEIWKRKDDFKAKKVNIVFIGNGKPEQIKMFKEDMNCMDAPIYTDPSLESFDACSLKRGALNLLDPRGAANMVKLKMKGYSQGPWDSNSGAHQQMGGVVTLKPPGQVLYHFVSDYIGDNDNPSDWKTE